MLAFDKLDLTTSICGGLGYVELLLMYGGRQRAYVQPYYMYLPYRNLF